MNTSTGTAQLTIRSNAFEQGGDIPQQYTCKGGGDNPALQIDNIPDETQSLALIMDDPDAPKGLFTHWVVWNIAPGTNNINENTNPGISGTNTAGKTGYHPPCPPDGRHRYFFKFYALDTSLDLQAGAERAALEDAMRGHVIAEGKLMGYVE